MIKGIGCREGCPKGSAGSVSWGFRVTRTTTLSQTDRDIVRLLYQGLGDAAIGRRLGLGHRTVQRRVQQLMRRWEAPGRVALGARAQELGLFDDRGSGERHGGAGPSVAA